MNPPPVTREVLIAEGYLQPLDFAETLRVMELDQRRWLAENREYIEAERKWELETGR